MKKLLVGVLVLFSASLSAQSEFNKWSIEPEVGAVKIRDVTSVRPFNVDLGVRFMANTKFGVKLSGNYSRIYEQWEFKGEEYPINYVSGALMGVVNIGRLLEFESFTEKYTILGGVGGNYSYSESPTNDEILHRLSNFHLAAFVDNEFKISKRVFMRMGMDVVTGVNSRPFISTTSTETTTILNFNVGTTIALGNGKKEHADWYLKETQRDTIMLQPTIIDKTVTKTEYVENECDCRQSETVYFTHDSAVVGIQGLNAIEKATDRLKQLDIIYLHAYCSNVGDVQYNKGLARRRAGSIKEKMVGIGVTNNIIVLDPIGIDESRDKKVHDMARRVEIEIKSK